MWWRWRICNTNHSVSFTFPILFFIEIHHFHPSHHCHSCGWSIGAALTNSGKICLQLTPSLRRFAEPVDKRGTTKVVNPTLCSTLCQLFVGCSCAPPHTHTRWPQIMFDLPFRCHTRFIHTSCLHIVKFTALSLSALIHSRNELRCPLARTSHTRLTLPIVCAIVPASRHGVRWQFSF